MGPSTCLLSARLIGARCFWWCSCSGFGVRAQLAHAQAWCSGLMLWLDARAWCSGLMLGLDACLCSYIIFDVMKRIVQVLASFQQKILCCISYLTKNLTKSLLPSLFANNWLIWLYHQHVWKISQIFFVFVYFKIAHFVKIWKINCS